MNGLSIPASNAPKAPFIGITFRRVDPVTTHVGLAWREGRDLHVLHQRWHMKLALDKAPAGSDAVVRVRMARSRVRPSIRYAKRMYQQVGKGLPYNFQLPNDVFDKATGRLLLGRGEGLTCSTLVLALLKAMGIELLDVKDWKSRPGDVARHEQLIEQMQAHFVGEPGGMLPERVEHLAYMKTQVDCVRFRPEEVAAAASIHPLPTTMDAVQPAVAMLLGAYDIAFPNTAPTSPAAADYSKAARSAPAGGCEDMPGPEIEKKTAL